MNIPTIRESRRLPVFGFGMQQSAVACFQYGVIAHEPAHQQSGHPHQRSHTEHIRQQAIQVTQQAMPKEGISSDEAFEHIAQIDQQDKK